MMRSRLTLKLLLAAAVVGARALTPAQWRAQSVYQVLTDRFALTDGSTTAACDPAAQSYCGGTWQGLIAHLDYIQGMGFTAIWISPFVAQMSGNTSDGEPYHGYWAQDIWAVNPSFGTSSDLVALSEALHSRGMYLMADVVTNHFAYNGCGTCVDYSIFNPFNSSLYFHPFCLINYNNATSIQVCWEGDNIVSLPDLRTEDVDVLNVWEQWITHMVSMYGIDGLRVDSAQQVNQAFFPPFSAAAGVHIVGEIFNGDPAYVCPYQQYMSGILNYPAYYWITQAFESTSGSISGLANGINTLQKDCVDTTLLGSFLENHDNARFPSLTSDVALVKNAIAFTMLMDGIPIIYEGQEQHYSGAGVPHNREAIWLSGYNTSAPLYSWITKLNKLRSWAIRQDSNYTTYKAAPMYSDSSTIVLRKGDTGAQIVSVFSNRGASGASYTLTLAASETGFTAEQSMVEVMGCTVLTTDGSGNLAVAMTAGLPRVFFPLAQLSGSGLCIAITGPSSTSTPAVKISSVTSTGAVKATSASTSACITPTAVAVSFHELATTAYGDTIKLVGNVSALGNWAPANAVALSAAQYTSSNPLWSVTIAFPPSAVIAYKFIKVASDGSLAWEADPNHTYAVPASCATTAVTVSSSWAS